LEKKKILMLCDHPLSTSGVGCQARFLINGLIATGDYTFRVLGGAIKHDNYDLVKVNDDLLIKPVDGFGNPEMLRHLLATERPDILFLFTDPRFFIWVWEMEDEIHQICPIAYWHVWDNDPYPYFNSVLYESTDLVNCHSYKTYEMVHENFPNRTNFIPHALPEELYFQLSDSEIKNYRMQLIGSQRVDHFIGFWINRNARRKMPSDVLHAWSMFLDQLEDKHGHKNATLIMHTDPMDQEGPNLFKVVENFNIQENVFFSTERIEFEKINVMHNIADFCINIACNEGFGLATLESMQVGNPIIALKTGGLTRQVVDHRDGSHNGVALDPDVRNLVGSQMVPFIYEDHVNNDKVADAFLHLYELGAEGRKELGQKAKSYVLSEFAMADTIRMWDETLSQTIDTWKNNRKEIYESWIVEEIA
jgi:glycosyltransferase involved in cell wall biosynthesis